MNRINTLFLLLTVVGPLHMGEQMMTSIEEFHSIQRLFGHYYALFDPAAADLASVALITIVWTVCSLLIYAILIGGIPKLAVLGVFAVFSAMEAHHVVQALAAGGYDAGLVTSLPYSALGCLMVAAVWRELRARVSPVAGAQRSFA